MPNLVARESGDFGDAHAAKTPKSHRRFQAILDSVQQLFGLARREDADLGAFDGLAFNEFRTGRIFDCIAPPHGLLPALAIEIQRIVPGPLASALGVGKIGQPDGGDFVQKAITELDV